MGAIVVAVSRNPRHRLHKENADAIRLIEGVGVDGDAHAGETVQHRSRKRWRPQDPNLRQVHLIGCELLEELGREGFAVAPGEMGENVTTRGIDLWSLPVGAQLRLGASAVVEVTGTRNPCVQLDRWQDGLMRAMVGRSGVMAVVAAGGEVRPDDLVAVELPPAPHEPLKPV